MLFGQDAVLHIFDFVDKHILYKYDEVLLYENGF